MKAKKITGEVYLIHADTPFRGGCQHYIGWTSNTSEDRLKVHKSGQGSRFLRYANTLGIDYKVVRVWKDKPYQFELELKKRKQHRVFCPVCNGKEVTA